MMTKKSYLFLFLLCLLPSILALPIDLIDIDTAQYGEIAREMIVNGDFLHLRDNGKKYLDKPILTFWTIATFFKIFGVSNITFRLPALLALILSSLAIHKLTELYTGSLNKARLASIFYLCIPGTFTIVLNPIIDIYLNLYLILTHLFYYLATKRNSNYYYLMYLSIGLGFITKGPISLVIPAISIGGDILLRRDWKRLTEMKIIQGIVITSILPLFWSYILYTEFKEYGPYFFLWLQSFGRFYKKMYDQKADPIFFYSNFLWGIFTLAIPFVYLSFQRLKIFVKENFSKPYLKSVYTWITSPKDGDYVIHFWVFVYLFLISFSKYQLPQYVYWAIPGGVIFLSAILDEVLFEKISNLKLVIFSFSGILALVGILLIPIFVIDVDYTYAILPILFLVIYFLTKDFLHVLIRNSVLPVVCIFSIISLFVFPELVRFQPSREVGKLIQELEPNLDSFYAFGLSHSKRSYEFYSKRLLKNVTSKDKFKEILIKDGKRLVLVPDEVAFLFPDFLGNEFQIKTIKAFPSYKIATPKPKFLMKKTRMSEAKSLLLLEVKLR
ncbi:MAG: glycosyltransferase family 39 protein [Leptospiraceae bacterium]|nr:glycosyltransferase family 39 protein [Leptospiraceae bacterium]